MIAWLLPESTTVRVPDVAALAAGARRCGEREREPERRELLRGVAVQGVRPVGAGRSVECHEASSDHRHVDAGREDGDGERPADDAEADVRAAVARGVVADA